MYKLIAQRTLLALFAGVAAASLVACSSAPPLKALTPAQQSAMSFEID